MNEQVRVLKQVELLGHQFTVYGTANNPLFLAKEVADIVFGKGRDKGTNARIVKGVDYFEKRTCVLVENGKKRKFCMLSLQGVYEVISFWKKCYPQPCFHLNSYLVSEFGKQSPKEKVTQVSNKESITMKGNTVIRSKVVAKTSIGKMQPAVVIAKEVSVKKPVIGMESISIPKAAAEIIKNIREDRFSAKDYLLESICRLIEVMYDPEDVEKVYEMKDLFPLYQMASQRKLIYALQTH
ncbi:hypothetical protein ABVC71_08100 [Prevotella amnii]|uniref:hypothetical protein n=1 Tax=Prevotella amnii TaxID=419005 RepID=UPI003369C79B